MDAPVFVARERELAQLNGFLTRALAGQGTVCFVTGEAGSGKTSLLREFAQRAEEKHTELAVAVGQSDAQTGEGDAHLPFREILAQLAGDVETPVARGAISAENARRLRKLLVVTVQALVEVGPDLVGIFVPGAKLLAKAGTFMAGKAGWLEKLEKLAKPREAGLLAGSGIEASHIFEQYGNVLCKLAEKRPLLLVLDDLQWADPSSVALLFRLGRRIEHERILLLGAYRPEEVAAGRGGERHPLEKVLVELKRYLGDVTVDLQGVEEEGRGFIGSLVDTEPNRLSDGFRRKLYEHTGGHALFTVELLRAMQERGGLVRDGDGRWVETDALDWESLPGRVEGVIEERIARLEPEMRRVLSVGSVEGEDFTAEVVARVQATEARVLVRRLSGELEREHRLVTARGVRQLDGSGQRLSQYRFRHNLFQKYLYQQLDQAERVYLHEDVGIALEELHGAGADEIAVQLARHFSEAGVADRARRYLGLAGRQAASRYANDEAITYLCRALELTPESRPEERYGLLLTREAVYDLKGEREHQGQDLADLEVLAQGLADDRRQAEVALRRASYDLGTDNYPSAIAAAQKAIRLAEAVHDQRGLAEGHRIWGRAANETGDNETARRHLEQAAAAAQAAELRQVECDCLRALGTLDYSQGALEPAETYFEESLRLALEARDRPRQCKALVNLAVVCWMRGEPVKAKSGLEQALSSALRTGDRPVQGMILNNLGLLSLDQCALREARTHFEQSLEISRETGFRAPGLAALSNLALVQLRLGDLAAARDLTEQALVLARELGTQREEARLLGNLGQLLAGQGDYAAAIARCEESLRLARTLAGRHEEATALCYLGGVCDGVGDYPTARRHLETSLEMARAASFRDVEAEVLLRLALVSHHVGEDGSSRDASRRAQAIAQESGYPSDEAYAATTLGHALARLDEPAEAADAYRHALGLRRRLCQPHLATEPLAGLARICLSQGKPGEALGLVEEVLGNLEQQGLEGTDEPVRIYLTCYRVLAASRDPRAGPVLGSAYRLLQDRAARIGDEAMRRSYLENVAAHRELVLEVTVTRRPAATAG